MTAERTEPVFIVSGGGTGIGRATTRALAEGGAHVVILGRRAQVLEAAAEEIEAEVVGSSIAWRQADMTDPEAVEEVSTHLRTTYGVLDGVVNCAGGGLGSDEPGLAGVAASWRKAFDQNVLSAVLLTNAVIPLLRRPGGRIVLVSSMASRTGGGHGEFVATKGALNSWVFTLASDLGREGITANVVAPGYTADTELFGGGLPPEIHDRIVSRIALGRAGRSEDVAGVIRFLMSPDAAFVSGQVIEVAGGSLPPNV